MADFKRNVLNFSSIPFCHKILGIYIMSIGSGAIFLYLKDLKLMEQNNSLLIGATLYENFVVFHLDFTTMRFNNYQFLIKNGEAVSEIVVSYIYLIFKSNNYQCDRLKEHIIPYSIISQNELIFIGIKNTEINMPEICFL